MTKGFGLIEMLVTLALVAILATVAVPSFKRLVNKTRVNSEVNSLVNAFYTARNYAVRNNTEVKFCAGKTCNSSNILSAGCVIKNNIGKIIKKCAAPNVTVNSFFNGSPFGILIYSPDGIPVNRPQGHIDVCSGSQSQKLFYNELGHIRTHSVNNQCSGCTC